MNDEAIIKDLEGTSSTNTLKLICESLIRAIIQLRRYIVPSFLPNPKWTLP